MLSSDYSIRTYIYPKHTERKNMFSGFSTSYQNTNKHPLMIVPAQLPRSENRLAEFARFSTHIHNRNVMTSSHVCKLMQHTDMPVCACVISAVIEWKALTSGGRERARHCQQGKCASTNDNRTHTTCMPGVR